VNMQVFSKSLAVLTALVIVSAVSAARAGVVLGANEWNDAGADLENWTEDEAYVTLTDPSSGGVDDTGYLQINYDGSRPGGEAETVVYTQASDLFAGDWTDEMWIEFDFWAEDATPGDLEVRFQSTGSSQIWSFNLTPPTPGDGWTGFTASLAYSDSLWYYGEFGGGSEEIFLADLSTIDWIGIYIFDGGTDANSYGLDNWQLMIPEPAEYALACSALAVTFLSLRRRKKKVLLSV